MNFPAIAFAAREGSQILNFLSVVFIKSEIIARLFLSLREVIDGKTSIGPWEGSPDSFAIPCRRVMMSSGLIS